MSSDFWSNSKERRDRVHRTIEELLELSIHITLCFTHISELLRHEDNSIAQERFSFLRGLPMIAWIKPYCGNWFVGGTLDLITYELHEFVHESTRGWSNVIRQVRPKILETGVGEDMFGQSPEIWEFVRSHCRRQLLDEIAVSSIARTDPYGASKTKLSEYGPVDSLPNVGADRQIRELENLKRELEIDILSHGDSRASVSEAASVICNLVISDTRAVMMRGGDPYQALIKRYGIPARFVRRDMTITELASLAVYVAHLETIQQYLRPSKKLSASDVPPDSLPSMVLQRALAREQRQADRVSGSDLGDAELIMLALYLDAVELDKRTHSHVQKICCKSTGIKQVLGSVFRSSEYCGIGRQMRELFN